jgi:hypothetical protein
VFDRTQLLAILDLAHEEDRSPIHLAAKITNALVRRGYLDARVTPELLGAIGDAQRALVFHIDEGHRNLDVFDCVGNPACNTYPDRLFYLGGVDSNRGFYPGQMLPQDAIDQVVEALETTGEDISRAAPRGGNVYINPRIELRAPIWKFIGAVLFLDAGNAWRDRGLFLRDREGNFAPLRLRYALGTGVSFETPVGPIAFDFGFNLSRYEAVNEPPFAFYFQLGRF